MQGMTGLGYESKLLCSEYLAESNKKEITLEVSMTGMSCADKISKFCGDHNEISYFSISLEKK